MPLWTDIIDPVEATAIARDEQYVIEQQRGGTLARFLPNVFVESDHVKFYPGQNGLVDVASYRAFNARPEVGKGQGIQRRSIDLPSIARSEPIDEITQKELARLSDDRVRKGLENAIKRNVQAISMRQELTRGRTIDQGKVVVDQDNFWINDDFERDASLSVVAGAGNWWADTTVDRLEAVRGWMEVYEGLNNHVAPGRMVFGSRAAYNAFAAGDQFKTLVGNASRPPQADELRSYSDGASLPTYEIYERTVQVGGVATKVLDPKKVYLLPEPVAVDEEEGSLLGATYWGRTVSSGYASWGIESDEQPGIVCGVFKDEKVGSSIEVEGDAIGEPILVSPNASMAIQVLE
ncbi:major capsid protein [Nocardioides bruguierae]|uniref:Major capsid protein n=1 Tax=Nocardioides bruguierae TaxID=2945102 RepID=A0A9X2DB86_9ACTN|nr:major capsid protein [Nocardioides bruguierae]MCM0622505.1 major capsid protein [Nocardioides bruguierae]